MAALRLASTQNGAQSQEERSSQATITKVINDQDQLDSNHVSQGQMPPPLGSINNAASLNEQEKPDGYQNDIHIMNGMLNMNANSGRIVSEPSHWVLPLPSNNMQ